VFHSRYSGVRPVNSVQNAFGEDTLSAVVNVTEDDEPVTPLDDNDDDSDDEGGCGC